MIPVTLRALTAEETAALEAALNLAARLAKAPRPLHMTQVQRLYDDFLAKGVTDEDPIIALGLAFGAHLVDDGTLVWAGTIDAYGEETVVAPPHHISVAPPISMIQKRLARKEGADLAQLRTTIMRTIANGLQNADRRTE